MTDSFDALFGGGKSAAFPKLGTEITGVITQPPHDMQQRDITSGEPKFYKDGNPMMQVVWQLQTDQRDPEDESDDGVRMVYAKGQMLAAGRAAARASGAKSRADLVGRTMSVKWASTEKAKQRGMNDKKIYEVKIGREVDANYVAAASEDDTPFN
jgi:hypothetical protein